MHSTDLSTFSRKHYGQHGPYYIIVERMGPFVISFCINQTNLKLPQL